MPLWAGPFHPLTEDRMILIMIRVTVLYGEVEDLVHLYQVISKFKLSCYNFTKNFQIIILKMYYHIPKFIFSGSQGRPDSRGPAFEVNEPSPPNTHISQPPVLKAALGPVISNGLSVAPRIRQLQMQISNNPPTTNNNNPTCAPRGSLV